MNSLHAKLKLLGVLSVIRPRQLKRAVTEIKKTKEKERYTGCQNRRFAKSAKTRGFFSILAQKRSETLRLGGGAGSAEWL